MKLRVGIIGVSGFSGEILLQILSKHSEIELVYAAGKQDRRQTLGQLYPGLRKFTEVPCEVADVRKAASTADIVFLALPHGESMHFAGQLLDSGVRVIDIGADYRFSHVEQFEELYSKKHEDKSHLSDFVYGLSEVNRRQIRGAKAIANPGCYPTSATLALAPLIDKEIQWQNKCVIDSKSGVTGAGRSSHKALAHAEKADNFYAYKVEGHQHETEINQFISLSGMDNQSIVFTPHLLPIQRGILSTIYLQWADDQKEVDRLRDIFTDYYKDEPFVNVFEEREHPSLTDVVGTNKCALSVTYRPETNTSIVISVIDNLMKGAAGQAVQNMNIMMGIDEKEGLE